MSHPAIYTLPFTLQLCFKPFGILRRVTKNEKAHISIHDGFQNFITSTLLYIGFALCTKLFKQLAYLSYTDNHHLLICTSEEDRIKKITSI